MAGIFVANVKATMDRRNMTAAALAEASKLNPTGIYDILKGKSRNPRLDTIEKVAAGLKVSVPYLLSQRPNALSDDDKRAEIVEIFEQMDAETQLRLIQAGLAWLPQRDSA